MNEPTPYATICHGDSTIGFAGCGQVFMTSDQYLQQMDRPYSTWRCVSCGCGAEFDDTNFEAHMLPEKELEEDMYAIAPQGSEYNPDDEVAF